MDLPLHKMGLSKKHSKKITDQYEVYKAGPLAVYEPNCSTKYTEAQKREMEKARRREKRNKALSPGTEEDGEGDSSSAWNPDDSGSSMMIHPPSVQIRKSSDDDSGQEVSSGAMVTMDYKKRKRYLKGNQFANRGNPGYISPKVPYPAQFGPPGNRIMNPNDLVHNFGLKGMFMQFRGIFLDQKFELTEALGACETKNSYYVYEMSAQQRRKGKPILRCKEYSDWCSRNCLTSDCRPMSIKCFNLWNHDDMCLEFERPCTCTFCCLARPQMKVYFTEQGQRRYIGKVIDNCDCVNNTFDVRDDKNETVYFVKGSCCQCGMWCNCPCRDCRKVYFDISSGRDGVPFQSRLIRHGKKSCCKNLTGDADDFSVPFPPGSTFEMRCLMLAVTLLIDYMMFDSGPGNSVNNVGGGTN